MNRDTLTGLMMLLASLVLAGLPFPDRLGGHEVPRLTAWCLQGQGLGVLCVLYFALVKRLSWQPLSAFLIGLMASAGLYFDIGHEAALQVPREPLHQACQGIIFLVIAYLAREVYKGIPHKPVISKNVWVSVMLYESYNFLEFCYYKIVVGLPSTHELMAAPSISAAMRTYGWEGHYVPIIVFISAMLWSLIKTLKIPREFVFIILMMVFIFLIPPSCSFSKCILLGLTLYYAILCSSAHTENKPFQIFRRKVVG